jgi:hypothetical protein
MLPTYSHYLLHLLTYITPLHFFHPSGLCRAYFEQSGHCIGIAPEHLP